MAKGRFKIKGTKDFLVAAVFCGFLCIWSIRDAWFPTQKILKKHPLEVPVSFSVPGVIRDIPVKPGQELQGSTILARLNDETYREKFETAKAAFDAAKEAKDPAVEEKLGALTQARADLEACTLKNTDITWTGSHGEEFLRGEVLRIVAAPATHVEAGEPILFVNPQDTFYLFNKTLALLTFLGTIVALIFHGIASR